MSTPDPIDYRPTIKELPIMTPARPSPKAGRFAFILEGRYKSKPEVYCLASKSDTAAHRVSLKLMRVLLRLLTFEKAVALYR